MSEYGVKVFLASGLSSLGLHAIPCHVARERGEFSTTRLSVSSWYHFFSALTLNLRADRRAVFSCSFSPLRNITWWGGGDFLLFPLLPLVLLLPGKYWENFSKLSLSSSAALTPILGIISLGEGGGGFPAPPYIFINCIRNPILKVVFVIRPILTYSSLQSPEVFSQTIIIRIRTGWLYQRDSLYTVKNVIGYFVYSFTVYRYNVQRLIVTVPK